MMFDILREKFGYIRRFTSHEILEPVQLTSFQVVIQKVKWDRLVISTNMPMIPLIDF